MASLLLRCLNYGAIIHMFPIHYDCYDWIILHMTKYHSWLLHWQLGLNIKFNIKAKHAKRSSLTDVQIIMTPMLFLVCQFLHISRWYLFLGVHFTFIKRTQSRVVHILAVQIALRVLCLISLIHLMYLFLLKHMRVMSLMFVGMWHPSTGCRFWI